MLLLLIKLFLWHRLSRAPAQSLSQTELMPENSVPILQRAGRRSCTIIFSHQNTSEWCLASPPAPPITGWQAPTAPAAIPSPCFSCATPTRWHGFWRGNEHAPPAFPIPFRFWNLSCIRFRAAQTPSGGDAVQKWCLRAAYSRASSQSDGRTAREPGLSRHVNQFRGPKPPKYGPTSPTIRSSDMDKRQRRSRGGGR